MNKKRIALFSALGLCIFLGLIGLLSKPASTKDVAPVLSSEGALNQGLSETCVQDEEHPECGVHPIDPTLLNDPIFLDSLKKTQN